MFKKTSSILALACLTLTAYSQKETKTEAREREQQLENDKKYFDDTDKDFDVTQVPDKWKNQSAVILCQKLSFSYFTVSGLSTNNYTTEETVRKRIKLLDKSSVEEFSKFYFSSDAKVGIRVIKASGKVENIDLRSAISESSTVPGVYRTYSINSGYKKLAIPGLETGDILDYYYSTENTRIARTSEDVAFKAFLFTLNSEYSTVKQILFFNVDKGYFVNFNAYNGAPRLVEGDAGVNRRGNVRENIKTYTLTDTDREKSESQRWTYSYRQYPTVKFQVVAASKNSYKDSEYFLGVQGEPKTAVSKKEIVLSMSRRFLNTTILEKYFKEYTVPFIVEYLKARFKAEKDPEKLMTEAYYCFRYKYAEVLNNPIFNAGEMHDGYIVNDSRIIDELFCEVMNGVAKKMKIKLEVFVAVPRNIGTFDEVLIPGELNIGVRVNNNLILSPPQFYSLHQTFDPAIEGCTALVFVPEDDPEKVTFSEITLPKSKPAQNIMSYNVTGSVDDNMELVSLTRVTSYAGHYKDIIPAYAEYSDDVEMEDKKVYDVDYKEKAEEKMKKSEKEARDAKNEKRKEYLGKVQDYLKEQAGEEYEIETYTSFDVLKTGRNRGDEVFALEEKFTVKNMVNKAGRNYTLNLGALIGSQVEIVEKERMRLVNIDMDYAKSINTEVSITIPAGYTVEGLSDLNINIDNASMAFISKATVEGNVIKVSVQKAYKVSSDKKENWKNWTDALDAAYNFTQKKVVLKKI